MSLHQKNNQGLTANIVCAALTMISAIAIAGCCSLLGDTYQTRLTIYGSILLWVAVGTMAIFLILRKSTKELTGKGFIVWLFSAWLWPIPVIMKLFRH